MKKQVYIICLLVSAVLFSCGSKGDKPVQGEIFTIKYDNNRGLKTENLKVVYTFDYWGTKGNNYQGAKGLFQNILFPDSGRAFTADMMQKEDVWVAEILIPTDVALLSYYFSDGDSNDYNEKKTFTSYVYDLEGRPVENSRFRNLDFLIMAGKSLPDLRSELRSEIADYPENWRAYTVYFRKGFEGAETFPEIDAILDEANRTHAGLIEQYGERDEVKHMKAEYLANYMSSLYVPFQSRQNDAKEEFMKIMKSIPAEMHHGVAKRRYASYLEFEKRRENSTKFLDNAVGSVAPDFSFKTIGGVEGKLSDYLGKYVLLDFWGTWCKPCVAEIPNLKKAFSTYHEQGFEIISISSDSFEADKLKDYVDEKEMAWEHILDGAMGPLQKLYMIRSYPSLFLIDPEGKISSINNDLRGDLLLAKLEEVFSG